MKSTIDEILEILKWLEEKEYYETLDYLLDLAKQEKEIILEHGETE